MSAVLEVGEFAVHALNDGTVRLPPMYYPGLDLAARPGALEADGTRHIPIGAFLIAGPQHTVLVDAGLGPQRYPFPPGIAQTAGLTDPPEFISEGGELLSRLAALGVAPADVDAVVLTHLHADHIGWIAQGGVVTFPAATVYCSAADWSEPLVDPAPGEAEGRAGLEVAMAAGRLTLLEAEHHEIAPGITARRIGGHTPGHTVVDVHSGGRRVSLIGDAVHHPAQLFDDGVSFLLEHDPGAALHARRALFDHLAGTGTAIGMTHLPGLGFTTIVDGADGRRRWAPA